MHGVLYGSIGDFFFKVACGSARSVKRHMPDVHITMCTDSNRQCGFFDRIIPLAAPLDDRDKLATATIGSMIKMPSDYASCLCLDCDTYACDDLSDVFDLVEGRFDIAVVPTTNVLTRFPLDGIPASFPFYNPGVMFCKCNDAVRAFLANWWKRFEDTKERHSAYYKPGRLQYSDQPAFRAALYHSDLRIATLRREYQCRFWTGFVSGPVKILHVRGKLHDWEKLEKKINEYPDKPRLYFERKVLKIG